MRKAIKYLVLGAIAGAAVVAAKAATGGDQPTADLPAKAAKTAGIGALAGGFVGLLLDRRSRRRRARRARKLAAVQAEQAGRRARKAAARAGRHKLAS